MQRLDPLASRETVRRVAWWAAPVVLALLVLGACSGGGSGSPATLTILEGTVEVSAGSTFVDASDGQEVGEGDTVRTGFDGRAEIRYPDGSVTRLDHDTEFTITRLRSGVISGSTQIEGRQASGNTYNRVVEITGSGGRFSVETPTASAAVQGTTYAVFVGDDGATTTAVLEGTVTVTTSQGSVEVPAGSSVEVGPDGEITGPFPTPDDVIDDEWIVYNECDDPDGCGDAVGPIVGLEITPANSSVNLGGSQFYQAFGVDADGNSQPVDATFSIAPDGSCSGATCTPASPGDHVVTATYEGLSDEASLIALTTGSVQATLEWGNGADLDLWVTDPFGDTVSWESTAVASGGFVDRDANAACGVGEPPPPENIVWPEGSAPSGEYLVTVHAWSLCEESPTTFRLTVLVDGVEVVSETGTLDADEMFTVSFEV